MRSLRPLVALAWVVLAVLPSTGAAEPVETDAYDLRAAVASHAEPLGNGFFRVRTAVGFEAVGERFEPGAVLVTSRCKEEMRRVPGGDEKVPVMLCQGRDTRHVHLKDYDFTMDPAFVGATLSYRLRGTDRTITWTGSGVHDPTPYVGTSGIERIMLYPDVEVCGSTGAAATVHREADPVGKVFNQRLEGDRTTGYMFSVSAVTAEIDFSTSERSCCHAYWWLFCR